MAAGKKNAFAFSDTAKGFFFPVLCQSHQPPSAPGCEQPKGRKASEQPTHTAPVKFGFKYCLKQSNYFSSFSKS